MRKILLFLISFAIIAMLDISTTFAQRADQNQQQRADNGKPYTVAIHKLNNKALNDSLLIETEDTTNFFSRRTSIGQLKNYIGVNLPDTSFNRVDTLRQESTPAASFLMIDNLGVTKTAPVTDIRNSAVFYWVFNSDSAQYISKSDSITTIDSDGDTIVFECVHSGGGIYDYNFRKKNGSNPNFTGTTLKITPVILTPTIGPYSTTIYPFLFAGFAGLGNGGSWSGSYYLGTTNEYGNPTIETVTLVIKIDLIY